MKYGKLYLLVSRRTRFGRIWMYNLYDPTIYLQVIACRPKVTDRIRFSSTKRSVRNGKDILGPHAPESVDVDFALVREGDRPTGHKRPTTPAAMLVCGATSHSAVLAGKMYDGAKRSPSVSGCHALSLMRSVHACCGEFAT
jgi:hypothetical protein